MTKAQKRVLVTGANKGIGRATVAAVLSARDDTTVLLGSRDERRGDEARAALLADNPQWAERIEALQIDVSDDESVAAAAEREGRRGTLTGQSPLRRPTLHRDE